MGGDGDPQAKALRTGTWGWGSGSREQGRRKRGSEREAGLGSGPPRTRPPLLSVTTAPSKVPSSSPVPLPMWGWSGVMVGQLSGEVQIRKNQCLRLRRPAEFPAEMRGSSEHGEGAQERPWDR